MLFELQLFEHSIMDSADICLEILVFGDSFHLNDQNELFQPTTAVSAMKSFRGSISDSIPTVRCVSI